MANELIISRTEDGLRIAILDNRRLVELHFEPSNARFAVGDVFLGQVSRIMPGMRAAFVNVGHERDGFLHYLDLGPQIKTQLRYFRTGLSGRGFPKLDDWRAEPDIDKNGKIEDVLKPHQPVVVQVMKEPISTKGPRLSSQLALAGQYLIYIPFGSGVAVSRKFESRDEKKRLKQLLEGILPPHTGVIVRTAAEGVPLDKLEADLLSQKARFEAILQALPNAKAPQKILSELDRSTGLLRDMLSIGFDAIITDDIESERELREYLQQHQPDKLKILRLEQPRQGLFEAYGIERQIKGAFGKNVNMQSGSYLVIEHTEALHVIDVNSGSVRFQNGADPETNALKINLEAAEEIARQLRLRDMGGIIVVDFIDMRRAENRRQVYEHLVKEMAKDRARHTVLPMSKFGLMQITRMRVRPEMKIVTEEVCPTCNGTGKVTSSILIADQVNRNVEYLIRRSKIKQLRLKLHPYLAAYFKHGMPSQQLRWFFHYKSWIRIQADNSLPLSEARYYDGRGEEIKLD